MFFLISVFSFEEITDYQNLVKRLKEESYNYFNESWSSFVNFNSTTKNGTIYFVFPGEGDEYILLSVMMNDGKYYLCNKTNTFSNKTIIINGKKSLVFCENGLIRATHFQKTSLGEYNLNVGYSYAQDFIDSFGRIVPGLLIGENQFVGIETSPKNINSILSISQYNFTLVDDLDNDSSGLGCILHGQFLTEKAPLQGSFVYLGKNLSVSNSGCCGDDGIEDNFIYESGSIRVGCFKGYAFVPGFNVGSGGITRTTFDYYYTSNEKYIIDNTKYIYNFAYFNGTHIVYAKYINISNLNEFEEFTKYYPLNLILAINDSKLVFAYCKNSDVTVSNVDIFSVDPLNNSKNFYIEVSKYTKNNFLLKNISELSTTANQDQPVFLCDGMQWRYFINKTVARNSYDIKVFNYTTNNFKPVKSYVNQNLTQLKYNYFKNTKLDFSRSGSDVQQIQVSLSGPSSRITYNLNTNYKVLF
ncbi:MAG: hypothetical protein QXR30_00670, partial [Candidatus Woesearchaeota archaeon]